MADDRIVLNRNGGYVIASPRSAAIARAGKAELRRRRREAAERIAREVLAQKAKTLPPSKVIGLVVAKGREYLRAWGAIVERQFEIALAGGRNSTAAARFVGEAAGVMGREAAKSDDTPLPQLQQPEELRQLLAAYREWKCASLERAAELAAAARRDSTLPTE